MRLNSTDYVLIGFGVFVFVLLALFIILYWTYAPFGNAVRRAFRMGDDEPWDLDHDEDEEEQEERDLAAASSLEKQYERNFNSAILEESPPPAPEQYYNSAAPLPPRWNTGSQRAGSATGNRFQNRVIETAPPLLKIDHTINQAMGIY